MSEILKLGGKFSSLMGTAAASNIETPAQISPSIINVLSHIFKRLFTYADWQILWFVFILIIILNWKQIWQKTELRYALTLILLMLSVVVYAFLDPVRYQFLLDGTLVHRTLMCLVPFVLYFTALNINAAYQRNE